MKTHDILSDHTTTLEMPLLSEPDFAASAYDHGDKNEECGFLQLNMHNQVVTINNALAKLLSMDTSIVNSRQWKSIFTFLPMEHKEWFSQMTNQAKAGKCSQHELLVKDEQNNETWIRFEFLPLYNTQNIIKGITCIGTNVNKEKMQEVKLAMQRLLLKKIADTYSHQLRHPLTNILAIISIMKHDGASVTNLYFQYLEKASQQLDAVIRTVVNQSYKAT